MEEIDVEGNRRTAKWSKGELAGRILWGLAEPGFRFSPRLCWGWRRFLLRLFGARIGREVQIYPSVKIAIPWNLKVGDWSAIGFDALIYNLGFVELGERVTISQRAHLCAGTHDFRDPSMPLQKCTIQVRSNAWICADAFVGPNVVIGDGAVVGARAVVVKPVEDGTVVAGNPARMIGSRGQKKTT